VDENGLITTFGFSLISLGKLSISKLVKIGIAGKLAVKAIATGIFKFVSQKNYVNVKILRMLPYALAFKIIGKL
jgi:hypothetical protein